MNPENITQTDIANNIKNKNIKHIILASGSPRRREILTMLGVKFDIIVADVDESTEGMDSSDPGAIAGELSRRKALAVYDRIKHTENKTGTVTTTGGGETVIIAADTIVYCNGRIFGKPHSHAEAAEMLSCYSGKTHAVVSGITVLRFGADGSAEPTVITAHEATEVDFKKMSAEEIERYVSTAEPYDKAGAYAVQGLAALYIKGIRGEYYNVVGLPVSLLYDIAGDIFE